MENKPIAPQSSWKFGALVACSGMALALLLGAGNSGFILRTTRTKATSANVTPGKVVTTALAYADRQSWCIANESASKDTARFAKDASLTTALGFELAPGQGYCEPIGGEPVYGGTVWVVFSSTAGTKAADIADVTSN